MSFPRTIVAVLLAAAAIGGVGRVADASAFGRVAGVFAALVLAVVAVGVARRQRWAVGAAFLLGLFWFWAAVALGVQGVLGALAVVVWLAWAAAVMIFSVRARA